MTAADAEVVVHDDASALATSVAARLVETLASVQREGRVPSVALTGGSVAAKLHAAVLEVPGRSDVDWSRVDFWFGDERYVPRNDPDRNALQTQEAMLRHLPVDPRRVHEMPASDDGHRDVAAAAAAYGEEVRRHGGGLFDVVMLGVGPDGHVASLFPGSPGLDVDDAITVAVEDAPKPPPTRISLTFAALNRAREVWFVVAGEEKAPAVSRGRRESDVHTTPAAGVRGLERTVWLLDRAAAGAH